MKQIENYKVLARADVLVPDYERMRSANRLCFVGRKVHRAPSVEALPAEVRGAPIRVVDSSEYTGEPPYVEAHEALRTPTLVPAASCSDLARREAGAFYRERLQEGGLWPADQETANACGIAFDAAFGGEYKIEATAAIEAATPSKKGV